jgi:hypothetical protein
MNTVGYKIVVLFALLALPLVAWGQSGPHELYIPQPSFGVYLNDLILADSLPNGQRVDPLRMYVLQRGGFYQLRTAIANTNWALRIKAANTTGERPAIFLIRNTVTNTVPGRMVLAGTDTTLLRNLVVTGYDESDSLLIGDINGAIITEPNAGSVIIIDSCVFTNTSGNHVRTDGAPRTVRITNSVFANMGYCGTSNLGAGKAIDLRAGSCDSLTMVNNTFVNFQDRIIRHFGSTANLQYLRFEHNTLINGMSYHGMLSLGRMGRRAIINNNLMIDAFSLGNDSDAVRQAEFTDSGERDQWGGARMTWVISNPNDTTRWTVKKNYYSVSATQQSFWDSASILPIVANPALTPGSPLTYHINAKIGSDSTTAFQRLDVTLPNSPRMMDVFNKWYRRPTASGGAGKTKATTNFARAFDFDRRNLFYFMDTLNCAYPTSSGLYTGAEGGYPAGDLNWFPARKHAWELDPISGVDGSIGQEIPTGFALDQNYPNPFNPSTKITFALAKAGMARLTVYNILGQKVATPFERFASAGFHDVSWNAAGLTTGVYFYRLESGNDIAVRKMMLVK